MTAPSRILVLGASGRTGRPLVSQALASGLRVRAFVRAPERLRGISHPALDVFTGDVLDAGDVARAVEGQDAVLSTLGRDGSDVRPLIDGTENVIRAMRTHGVERLVCMSSMGAGSTTVLAGPVLNFMIRLMGLKHSFDAKAVQERMLFESELRVSLLFAGSLSDGKATGRPRVTTVADAPRSSILPPEAVTRADVAAAMLTELRANEWVGRPACVVGPGAKA